jgi:MFS family permease
VLVLVYVFNFLDRQILSILAERIKADLQLTDAQIGFLYGTAFAVFYALFGIPLGRLADCWIRTRLIAIGLTLWSAMTATSAFARDFVQLTAARIGVGVGEASASPAAYSLLADYFPPAKRATVLALYSGGIYIGAGLGLGIGGVIVEQWDAAFAGAGPLGLRGWQVAFLVVGLAGLPLALWVNALREPIRGSSEGRANAVVAVDPLREFGRELTAVIPPLTIFHLLSIGATRTQMLNHAGVALLIAVAVAGLIAVLGTPAQWMALGLGVYAACAWSQALGVRDPATHRIIFGSPVLRYVALGFACLAFNGYGLGFWAAPFLVRDHGVSEAEAGLWLGGTSAVAGWLGVTFGGVWADRWHRTNPRARLYVGMVTAVAPLPFVLGVLYVSQAWLVILLNIPVAVTTSMWIGAGASTVQDLVPPPLRATASAAYLLVVTFIGLALGPYTMGRVSMMANSLRTGMLVVFATSVLALLFLSLAARHLERERGRKGR